MKRIFALLIIALTVSVFSLSALASSPMISDRYGMLSPRDEAAVTEALSTAKSRTGADFYVYFSDATVSGRVWEWDIEDEFSIDGDDSAVILLIEITMTAVLSACCADIYELAAMEAKAVTPSANLPPFIEP